MACTIARNRKGEIMEVYAPNRKSSLLFNAINERVNNKELSVKIWLTAYTPSFMKKTNNWSGLQLDQNGEPIVQFKDDQYSFLKKDTSLSPSQEINKSFTEDSYVEILDKLASKFGVSWTIDNEQSSLGRLQNNQVIVNLKKIQPDTPFHEYGHIFEQIIRTQNKPLWANLSRKVTALTYNGVKLTDFVREKYPDLKGDDINAEAIVTAIGLHAVDPKGLGPDTAGIMNFQNSIRNFFKWIADYLNQLLNNPQKPIKAEDLSENMRFKDLADLMKLQNPIETKGRTFSDSEQKQSLVDTKVIQTIYQQNEGVELNENDPSNTFYQRGTEIFKRLTEWVGENFSSESKKNNLGRKKPAEWLADKYYRKKNVNTSEPIVWDATGKMVNYDEVVAFKQKELDKTRYEGNVVHAFIENFIKDTQESRDKVEKALEDGGLEAWQYDRWMTDNFIQGVLINDLGLNIGDRYSQSPLMDKLASEVTITSDILGVGSRIDNLVEHSNGSVSLIDFKTGGGFLNDSNTFDQMPYGNLIDDVIRDSKLDKAKMELMVRALILKEKNPDLKFRDLRIAHLQRNRKARLYDVSMKNYLQVLSDHFKNTDEEKYNKLKNAGLLKFENYTSQSKVLAENQEENEAFRNMPKESQIQYLSNKLEALDLKYPTDMDEEDVPNEAKKKRRELTSQILELGKESDQDFLADTKDQTKIERWFGVFYDVANPMVQKFLRIWQDSKFKAVAEYNQLYHTQLKLVAELKREYFAKYPSKVLGNKIYGDSIQYHTDDNQGFFDFMWERKTVGNDEGYFARIITEEDVKSGKYTQAQYNYNKWYRDTLKDLWSGTMKVKIGDRTKEQIWGGTYGWNPTFMPRIPLDTVEVAERDGIVSKNLLKSAFSNYSDFFVKEQYKDVNNNFIGLPVKYTGSQRIIVTQNHSLHAEKAMLMFAQNMINKKHLDQINSLGQGVMTLLKRQKDPATNKVRFKNTIEWLDDFLKRQVTGQHEDLRLSRNGAKIPFTDKQVNSTRLFDSANSYITASTMWLNVAGGMFNSIMYVLYNVKEGIKGSWAKFAGVNIEDIDYTLSDFFKGTQHWLREGLIPNASDKFVNDYKQGVMKSKLYRFVELMNFDTKNFSYSVNKGDLMVAKGTLLDYSHLFLAHSLGEEYGSFSQMAAMLERKKVKDAFGNWVKIGEDGNFTSVATPKEASSMWEAYKVTEDGAFVYTGPVRGVTSDGREIKGLTSDEINKMRKFNQRVNGSYREEEKAAVEMWAMGRWIMKFKKYLPAIINTNFQGKFNDWSIGNYEEIAKDSEGRSVLEWSTAVNEGRFWVFLKFLTFGIANKFSENPEFDAYRWENMSPEQQKMLLDATLAMFMYFGLFIGGFAYWDDDDKNSKVYRRYQRLTEDMIQIHPVDLLRTAANPLLQTQQMFKMAEASQKFFMDGLVMGQRVQSGPNAGKLPGESYLRSKTPIVNIANQFGLLDDEDDPETVNFLNRR